ncbi:MAG: hypothetical protein HZY76_07945 [Anaerolineae bacterium]|nr:MAG: hypothetical protein HZY76_07945 [Anaerolineae bacterium]
MAPAVTDAVAAPEALGMEAEAPAIIDEPAELAAPLADQPCLTAPALAPSSRKPTRPCPMPTSTSRSAGAWAATVMVASPACAMHASNCGTTTPARMTCSPLALPTTMTAAAPLR